MTATGIMYMAFGDKAAEAVRRSVSSVKKLNINIPIVVVGDRPIGDDLPYIGWSGYSCQEKRDNWI